MEIRFINSKGNTISIIRYYYISNSIECGWYADYRDNDIIVTKITINKLIRIINGLDSTSEYKFIPIIGNRELLGRINKIDFNNSSLPIVKVEMEKEIEEPIPFIYKGTILGMMVSDGILLLDVIHTRFIIAKYSSMLLHNTSIYLVKDRDGNNLYAEYSMYNPVIYKNKTEDITLNYVDYTIRFITMLIKLNFKVTPLKEVGAKRIGTISITDEGYIDIKTKYGKDDKDKIIPVIVGRTIVGYYQYKKIVYLKSEHNKRNISIMPNDTNRSEGDLVLYSKEGVDLYIKYWGK